MFVVEIDSSKRFVVISLAGHVTVEEAKATAERAREVVADAEPGFVALADYRWVDSMATGAAVFIGQIMDAFAAKEVRAVVRVMPDPHKDIGLNILSPFHYRPETKLMTFETLADAVQALSD
jgi:hypothetical protein